MPIVVVLAGALAQAVEAGVAALEEATHGGCSKRSWRTPLFWRLRAEIRKQASRIMAAATCRTRKGGGRGGRSSGPGRFGYDPFSYALNFDDGVATLFPTLFTIVTTTTAKVAMLAPAVSEEEGEEKGADVPPDDPSLPQTEDKGLIIIQ